MARRGICVNAVSPGPTATDLFLNGKPEAVVKMISGLDMRTPEEIAETVAFLSGEGGNWVSGQVLRVNGGSA